MNSGWAGNVKTENDPVLYGGQQQLNFMDNRQSSFSESFPRSYRGKQFPFLQGGPTNPTLPGTSVCQPLLDHSSASGNGGVGHKMFSDGLNRAINSDRALSLLSSPPPPPPPETQEIGLINMMNHNNQIPPAQSLIPSQLHYNNGLNQYAPSSQGMGESVGSVLVSDGSSNGIFHLGPDGSSTNCSHQTLSFSWE